MIEAREGTHGVIKCDFLCGEEMERVSGEKHDVGRQLNEAGWSATQGRSSDDRGVREVHICKECVAAFHLDDEE